MQHKKRPREIAQKSIFIYSINFFEENFILIRTILPV